MSDEAMRLFREHGAALYRFARVMLHRDEDAQDAVQGAFVRLLEHLERGGGRANLKAWLFTVTVNLCRDQLRARRRWVPWGREHEAGLIAEPEVDARDEFRLFLAAARRLPARDRLLLALRAQGLSYREIAAATGIREASVGQLLARAVARWQRARDAAPMM
jgi:RNA polymerase sigma-70 factor (ECF subfamily)